MNAITVAAILVITGLMFWPHSRRQVREQCVSRVRASIAPWLTPDLAAPQQPTVDGDDPPTVHVHGGCSRTAGPVTQTSGPAVPTRVHLDLADLPVDHGHHWGCAS